MRSKIPGGLRPGQSPLDTEARKSRHTGTAPLTPREIRVLCLVAEGLSNPEIAAHLHISPATAKTHVGRIIAKLEARDRTHAAVKAIQLGIIKLQRS